jgi:hypothetical protein
MACLHQLAEVQSEFRQLRGWWAIPLRVRRFQVQAVDDLAARMSIGGQFGEKTPSGATRKIRKSATRSRFDFFPKP